MRRAEDVRAFIVQVVKARSPVDVVELAEVVRTTFGYTNRKPALDHVRAAATAKPDADAVIGIRHGFAILPEQERDPAFVEDLRRRRP